MIKEHSLKERYPEIIFEFKKKVDQNENISAYTYLQVITKLLVKSKRLFDLAALYTYLKNRHNRRQPGGKIFISFKKVLKQFLNELFIVSLTYSSTEIDLLFFDIMGEDKKRFMELIGHVFKTRKLFHATLSRNIWSKFIAIADENPRFFIKSVNNYFLSFYLSNMPHIPFVPAEHISKWTRLILSPSTNRQYHDKILDAMEINASPEILFIMLLVSKDEPRGRALDIVWDFFKKNQRNLKNYSTKLSYFLKRAISSHFYDFHQISQKQKIIFANLIMSIHAYELLDKISIMITEKNVSGDTKYAETKKIFINLLAKLGKKNPQISEILREFLKSENIQPEIKKEIGKAIIDINSPESNVSLSP